MKIDITVPDKLSEITLGQYQKYLKIQSENTDERFLSSKMIEIFCELNLTDVMKLKLADVNAICSILSDMFNDKPTLRRTFFMDGVEYGFIPNLEDISFGEYIDLDNYLADWNMMDKAMGVLYRPIKNKYGKRYSIQDYEGKETAYMKAMPLDVALSAVIFFLSFRDRLINDYDELFGKQGGDSFTAVSQFGAKWGWYSSVHSLAQGDITRFENITKLNIHTALYALSYMKEKSDLEAKQIKNKFK